VSAFMVFLVAADASRRISGQGAASGDSKMAQVVVACVGADRNLTHL
jgi:hypothetical protein